MELIRNMVGWFEIPVEDIPRAIKFYETVFEVEITPAEVGDLEMGWFPFDEKLPGSTGSLVKSEGNYKPSTDGIAIYFTSQAGDIAVELSRVEAAGGKIVMPKTLITEDIGYMGLFIDSEGNRIAIHSVK